MILTGRSLTYRVEGRTILDDIDVDAPAGELLAVSGPSGAGKSTLLTLLGGLVTPSEGTVALDGVALRGDDQAVRRRIGFGLQGYGLVTALTGRENVAITLQSRGLARAEVRERATQVLEQVGLAEVADHLIEDMSGGQQQRVAVARALVTEPDVLIVDEPTAELDAENRERIVGLLVARARAGSIVVVASHDPDVVDACDARLDLADGRIAQRR